MSSQYGARQFLSELAAPTFASGFSELVGLMTRRVISRPSMQADLTPILKDPILQDTITPSTTAAKMFFFMTIDETTDTVLPLKDAGSGQAG